MSKCRHGRDDMFCCTCSYGNTGKHDLSPNEEEPRDLVYEINRSINKRLQEAEENKS